MASGLGIAKVRVGCGALHMPGDELWGRREMGLADLGSSLFHNLLSERRQSASPHHRLAGQVN